MLTVPKVFILDVDGVLTDGCFYYSIDGKVLKKFGPDDRPKKFDSLEEFHAWLEEVKNFEPVHNN